MEVIDRQREGEQGFEGVSEVAIPLPPHLSALQGQRKGRRHWGLRSKALTY